MRRLFTTSLFTLLPFLAMMAQYTTDGYYRVRNYATQRYIYITDNTGSYDMSRDVGDFGAIQLWKGEDRPISDPASIIYIHKTSSDQFDLQGQNTGIFALVKRFVDVHQESTGAFKGSYTVGATSHGVSRFLCDMETSTRPEQGAMGTSRQAPYRNWTVFPVSANTTSYFGIKPNVSIGLKRYYPFYAAFPFELYSTGLKAYIISKVDERLNMAVLKEVTGVIPAMTPVIIECPSAQPTSNRLELVVSNAKAPTDNLLGGVLFCNEERPNSSDALTAFNKQTMRLLGRTSSGKLGFISTSTQLHSFKGTEYLPANQAYLKVKDGTASELTVVTEEEYQEALANIKYTITYMVDGEVFETVSLKPGQEVTPPEAPEKEGYTFNGWTGLPSTMPEKDITTTASYTINTYKITYIVDGEEFASQTVEYGSKLSAVEEPEKEGYTFSGWSEIPSTMPANDVTVTGSFAVNSYILTYIVDGEKYVTQTVEYGSTITVIESPEKDGYTFSGWSETPSTMPANDVTVTGSFTINSYSLTYIVDGEEYATQTVEYGSTITAIEAPEKEGYTFSGWSEIPATMPADNITIVGTFSVNSYTITYIIDGETIYSQEVEFGSTIEPITPPEKENYEFAGWENVPNTMPAHDITIIGKYDPIVGINKVSTSKKDTNDIYDMSGRRRQTIRGKGIYIIKGKKIAVKN